MFYREETLSAIDEILQKTPRQEMMVQARFHLLQRIAETTGAVVDISDFSYIPLRIEVPSVSMGFVYLLVSMADKHYRTCIIKETSDNLMTELSRFNSLDNEESRNLKHLLPWSVAAFSYNFQYDEQRHKLVKDLYETTQMGYRFDTVLTEFEILSTSGCYGQIAFCKCVRC